MGDQSFNESVAVQHGPIQLTGQLGGISFYEMGGKFYARRKTCHSAERIKTDPAFTRTNQNSLDFATAVNASTLLRSAWANVAPGFADKGITSRLNGRFVKVLQADITHQRGSRRVSYGDLALLQGFEFNKHQPLHELFPSALTVLVNRAAGHVTLSLQSCIEIPDTLQAQLVVGIICVDFERRTHTAYRYQRSLVDFVSSNNTPLVLDAPSCTDPSCAIILTFGILQQPTASNEFLANSAMSIVAVEPPFYMPTVYPGSIPGISLRENPVWETDESGIPISHPVSHHTGIEFDTGNDTTADATPLYNKKNIKDINIINRGDTTTPTPDLFGDKKSNAGYTQPPTEKHASGAGGGGPPTAGPWAKE